MLKDFLLKIRRTTTVTIDGTTCNLRELSIGEIIECKSLPESDLNVRLIILSVTDPKGQPVFSGDDAETIRSTMAVSTLNSLITAIGAINGFDAPPDDRANAAAAAAAKKK